MVKRSLLAALMMAALLAAGCASPRSPSATAAVTVTGSPSAAPSASATPAPTSSPTAIRTPPALPALFKTDLLNPKDTPHTYIADACQQLKDKWTPGNAAPGTVVLPVMFHSVADQVTTPNQISFDQFRQLMKGLKARGFEAIDTAQLAGFLEHNAEIPPRSVILIADDRHYAEYFNRLFRPYHDKYDWPVVNAWISAVDTPPGLWQENVDLEKEGWVDHQAHGVVHNIPAGPGSSDQYLLGELQGSIDAFKQHFDKTPMAYIWPGGGFTPRSVELARQTGYQLGFTVNPRGPVMFDWVPQADKTDDMRPSYIAEGPAGDPLLTLPRYWDTDALSHIDTVVAIGDAAVAYAQQNKATELEYYDIVCAPTLGPLAGQ